MSGTSRAFVISGLSALVVGALLHLLFLIGYNRAWPAMVHITLAGWITAMILAVKYRTIPVFVARDFPYERMLAGHWACFTLGIAAAVAGLLSGVSQLYRLGLLLQLIAALVFVAHTMTLFLRGVPRGTRPPSPRLLDEPRIDRIGTQATKRASLCLPFALALLLAVEMRWLSVGWILAAEHLMALGWTMLMIVGVAYHVLPRFSGRALRGLGWVQVQFHCHTAAIILTVLALGMGWPRVFVLGAILMLLALISFAWTVWPTLVAVRPRSVAAPTTVREHPV